MASVSGYMAAVRSSSSPRFKLPVLPQRLPSWAGWSLVAALIVVEFLFFRHYVRREVAWAYPPNTDQVAYLNEAYETYESMKSLGTVRAIQALPPIPQGALMRIQAGLFFLVAGPSRASALDLNFIYFAMLQCAMVWAVRWLSGRWDVGWVALGLLLSAATPFLGAGGIADFRMDFIAFCLYGMLLCVVIRSGVLSDWRWAPAVALFAAALIGFRFIAAVYVGGVMGLLALLFAARFFSRNPVVRRGAVRRSAALLVAGAMIALLVAPLLWANRNAIHDYYWVNHVSGAEKQVRAAEVGASGWATALMYYPRSLVWGHAGPAFLALAGALLLGAALGRVAFKIGQVASPEGHTAAPAVAERRADLLDDRPLSLAWIASGVFLIVPLVALTLDVSKSPVVAGIMVGPLVWLVILGVVTLLRGHFPSRATPLAFALGLAALASVGWGVRTQAAAYSRDRSMSRHRRDVQEVTRLYDDLSAEARKRGWSDVGVFCTSISDCLDGQLASVLAFERHGYILHAGDLTTTVLEIPEPDVFRQIAVSEFVILSRRVGPPPLYDYPFNLELEAMRPRVESACERDMIEIGRYRIYDREVRLFVRRSSR